MDINPDPDCVKAMDPHMSSATGLAQMTPWPWVIVQATQIGMAPVFA